MLSNTSEETDSMKKTPIPLVMTHIVSQITSSSLWFDPVTLKKSWDSCLNSPCLYDRCRKITNEELGNKESWSETCACLGRRRTSPAGFCGHCCFPLNRVAKNLPSHKFILHTSKEFCGNPRKEQR